MLLHPKDSVPYTRTSIDIPNVIRDCVKEHIGNTESLKSFVIRAMLNQLENEYLDFRVREKYEELVKRNEKSNKRKES